MNSKVVLGVTLRFDDVFDEQIKPPLEYLQGINQATLLHIASHFLGFKKDSENNNYRTLIGNVFRESNREVGAFIANKIFAFEERQAQKAVIINAKSSLSLFQHCFDNATEQQTQTEEEAEINVFKSYLAFNQEMTELEMKAFSSTKKIQQPLQMQAAFLSQSYPYSDLINYDLRQVLITQMIKAVFLFEFLEGEQKSKRLCGKFLEYYECQTWQEYLSKIMYLAFIVVTAEKDGSIDINFPDDEKLQSHKNFISKLSLNIDTEQLLSSADFYKIRSKPLYQVSERKFRVIYPLFVLEKVFTGIYFQLSQIHNNLLADEKYSDFRSFIGKKFSEECLLSETIKLIYGKKYKQLSSLELKDIDGAPDFYLRKGNKIFLFESKDVMVKPLVKASYDFEQYKPVFEERFYYAKKGKKTDPKAILQLIESIKGILNQSLEFDKECKGSKSYIYPVIVVHDRQFNLLGLNALLNSWFQDELSKLKESGYDIKKVKPLVILDIDTLIYFQDALSRRVVKLEDAFEEYYSHTKLDRNKRFQTEFQKQNYFLKSLTPFSLFFENYVLQRTSFNPPQLMERGMDVLLKEIKPT